jgi:hypothetical protein
MIAAAGVVVMAFNTCAQAREVELSQSSDMRFRALMWIVYGVEAADRQSALRKQLLSGVAMRVCAIVCCNEPPPWILRRAGRQCCHVGLQRWCFAQR